jgi:hypothetical protein
MWRRALLVWVLLVGLAILNGAARETVLTPSLGPAVGHLASSVLLAGLIALTAWLSILWIAPGSARRAWAVGALWMSLTVAFEFLAGHYVFGHPGRGSSRTTTSCRAVRGFWSSSRRLSRRPGRGGPGHGETSISD